MFGPCLRVCARCRHSARVRRSWGAVPCGAVCVVAAVASWGTVPGLWCGMCGRRSRGTVPGLWCGMCVAAVGPLTGVAARCSALAADGSPALHLLHRQIRVSPAEPREARAPSARSRAGRAAARRAPPEPSGPCHAERLPAELLQLVLSHLPLQQLLAAQRVSQRWRDAVRDLLRRRPQLDLRSELQTAPAGGGRLTDRTLRYLLRLMPALRVLRTGGNVRTCSYKALDIVGEWPVW